MEPVCQLGVVSLSSGWRQVGGAIRASFFRWVEPVSCIQNLELTTNSVDVFLRPTCCVCICRSDA